MNLRIGIHRYRVELCPGPLRHNGQERGAAVLGRTIYIAGDVDPRDRLLVLLDQARLIWEVQLGTALPSTGVAAFAADMLRQLARQGAEHGLLRVRATVPDPGDDFTGADIIVPEKAGEGVYCGHCGKRYDQIDQTMYRHLQKRHKLAEKPTLKLVPPRTRPTGDIRGGRAAA